MQLHSGKGCVFGTGIFVADGILLLFQQNLHI